MNDYERNRQHFYHVSENCPWKDKKDCAPSLFKLNVNYLTKRKCDIDNCPIMHFQKFFSRPEVKHGQ